MKNSIYVCSINPSSASATIINCFAILRSDVTIGIDANGYTFWCKNET